MNDPRLISADSHVDGVVVEGVAAARKAAPTWRDGLNTWIEEHDYRWLFVVVYLGLAVVLSVFVSLFWLVLMVGLHFLLECVRHRHPGWGTWRTLGHAAWEVKMDAALVLLAFAAVLYVDVVLGILGVQSAARAATVSRAGVRIASRIAAWERHLRGFLVTVDEMVRIVRAVFMLRSGPADDPLATLAAEAVPAMPWHGRWKLGDHIALGITTICVLVLVAAPFLTPYSLDAVTERLVAELQPFPS